MCGIFHNAYSRIKDRLYEFINRRYWVVRGTEALGVVLMLYLQDSLAAHRLRPMSAYPMALAYGGLVFIIAWGESRTREDLRNARAAAVNAERLCESQSRLRHYLVQLSYHVMGVVNTKLNGIREFIEAKRSGDPTPTSPAEFIDRLYRPHIQIKVIVGQLRMFLATVEQHETSDGKPQLFKVTYMEPDQNGEGLYIKTWDYNGGRPTSLGQDFVKPGLVTLAGTCHKTGKAQVVQDVSEEIKLGSESRFSREISTGRDGGCVVSFPVFHPATNLVWGVLNITSTGVYADLGIKEILMEDVLPAFSQRIGFELAMMDASGIGPLPVPAA